MCISNVQDCCHMFGRYWILPDSMILFPSDSTNTGHARHNTHWTDGGMKLIEVKKEYPQINV